MIAEEIFLQYGLIGVVLGWLMFRMEKVINNNTRAINEVKLTVASCPSNKKNKKM